MRLRFAAALLGLLTTGAALLATGAAPAHAAGPTGLCATNYTNTCARETSPYVDAWPQDISGDGYQEYAKLYQAQVSNSWPFSGKGAGYNSVYSGNGVYEFQNVNTTNCMTVYGYQNQANARGCGSTGDLFVWTATGALVNVFQTDYYGQVQYLVQQGVATCSVEPYKPLVTWNAGATCITTWTMRNGS